MKKTYTAALFAAAALMANNCYAVEMINSTAHAGSPVGSPVELSFNVATTAASTTAQVVYAAPTPDAVTGTHSANAVAQKVILTIPEGATMAELSSDSTAGTNQANSKIALIKNGGTVETSTNKNYHFEAGKTFGVALVASNSTPWLPGLTSGSATITFYVN